MNGKTLDWKQLKVEELTLEQKIGQVFVTGFPGKQPSEEFLQLVKEEKVGNVILFTHNVESKEQMAGLDSFLMETITKETGIPPFITIDEEGGVVSRLPEETAIMPSAMAQSAAGEKELIQKGAKIAGEELLALGVNFNLAPILDINSNQQNPVIGVRSYGETAEDVYRFGSAAVRGYREAGIMCSGKHFPGHGDTAMDSHLSLPIIEGTMEELEERELLPFKRLIEEGIPAITIAHIRVPAMNTGEIPCTMSKQVVTGYLREKLGFKGLIISDCMEMDAIKKYFGVGKGVVEGLRAGIDLVFVSHTASAVKEAVEAVKQALADGTLTMERLDEAVSHVLEAKAKYAAGHEMDLAKAGTDSQHKFMKEFLQKTIVPYHRQEAGAEKAGKEKPDKFSLGDNPLFAGAIPSRVTLASSAITAGWDFAHYMQQKFGGSAMTFGMEPSEEEIAQIVEAAKNASSVVIATLNGHLFEGQGALIEALNRLVKEDGKKGALIALRNPYELKQAAEEVFGIPLYEYSVRTMDVMSGYFVK